MKPSVKLFINSIIDLFRWWDHVYLIEIAPETTFNNTIRLTHKKTGNKYYLTLTEHPDNK